MTFNGFNYPFNNKSQAVVQALPKGLLPTPPPFGKPATWKATNPLADVQLAMQTPVTWLGTPAAITSNAGSGFTAQPVAILDNTINDPSHKITSGNCSTNPQDFKCFINWGDGTSWDGDSAKLVYSGTNGRFEIDGSHVYQNAGTYNILVYVIGPDGTSLSQVTCLAQVNSNWFPFGPGVPGA